jgi:protein-disulfide isomerase
MSGWVVAHLCARHIALVEENTPQMNAYSEPRQTKNERRAEAREKARQLREQESKKSKRKKVILQSSLVVGTLAIIGVVTFFVISSITPPGPGPLNMQADSIKIGQGFVAERTPALEPDQLPVLPQSNGDQVPNISIFVDYSCPACKQFEEIHNPLLRTWLQSGTVTVSYHPLSFRDAQTAGQRYATRAANSAACVANFAPDSYFDYNEALLASQPVPPESVSLSNNQLIELTASVVPADVAGDIAQCIRDESFSDWVEESSRRAMRTGPLPVKNAEVPLVTGTPTILVNGKLYNWSGNPADLAAFVATVEEGNGEE